MELTWVGPEDLDVVLGASELFDDPVRTDLAQRFLAEPTHHLCIAAVDGEPVGFVSGTELHHPDAAPEMYLNEIGVADTARGRGTARELVRALAARAREVGCEGMWVLTDRDNLAAIATFTSAGASRGDGPVMMEWSLD